MGKAELQIDADLLAEAQAAGLKVEAIVEHAVRVALCSAMNMASPEVRAAAWAAANSDAIAANRARIEADGVFGEDLRSW
jgi:post-segregation antitoxin (ccd killing protein)